MKNRIVLVLGICVLVLLVVFASGCIDFGHEEKKVVKDSDGDGIPDKDDAFPYDSTEWKDSDSDGVGDNSDAFPYDASEIKDNDNDGVGDNSDTDDDNDGMSDAWENTYGLNPLDGSDASADTDGDGYTNLEEYNANTNPSNSTDHPTTPPVDTDGDGTPNTLDTDDDNDGVLDVDDAFPLDANESVDTDEDGIGNNADLDDDNDGYTDVEEEAVGTDPLDPTSYPTEPPSDIDGDGYPDSVDAFPDDSTQWEDSDGDGYGDNTTGNNPDLFPDDPSEWNDTDDDGYGDNGDAFPNNPNEWLDTDNDGIGNNEDTDDDNDGYSDSIEISEGTDPLANLSTPLDFDGDFIPDSTDPDDDNDGVSDEDEINKYNSDPKNPNDVESRFGIVTPNGFLITPDNTNLAYIMNIVNVSIPEDISSVESGLITIVESKNGSKYVHSINETFDTQKATLQELYLNPQNYIGEKWVTFIQTEGYAFGKEVESLPVWVSTEGVTTLSIGVYCLSNVTYDSTITTYDVPIIYIGLSKAPTYLGEDVTVNGLYVNTTKAKETLINAIDNLTQSEQLDELSNTTCGLENTYLVDLIKEKVKRIDGFILAYSIANTSTDLDVTLQNLYINEYIDTDPITDDNLFVHLHIEGFATGTTVNTVAGSDSPVDMGLYLLSNITVELPNGTTYHVPVVYLTEGTGPTYAFTFVKIEGLYIKESVLRDIVANATKNLTSENITLSNFDSIFPMFKEMKLDNNTKLKLIDIIEHILESGDEKIKILDGFIYAYSMEITTMPKILPNVSIPSLDVLNITVTDLISGNVSVNFTINIINGTFEDINNTVIRIVVTYPNNETYVYNSSASNDILSLLFSLLNLELGTYSIEVTIGVNCLGCFGVLASDNTTFSVSLIGNQPPVVNIISPSENVTVFSTTSIEGIAYDPNPSDIVDSVEVAIDDPTFVTNTLIVTGINLWNVSWDTTGYTNGVHTIYARAYDGTDYSDIDMVNVTVNNIADDIYEENDDSGNATVLTEEGTYNNLQCLDDDWYKIYLNTNEGVTVTINFTHSIGANLDMKLYDTDAETVLDSSITFTNNEQVSIPEVSVAGYYFIKVYGYGGATNNYNMTVEVTNQPPTAVILNPPTEITANSMLLSWSENNDSDFSNYTIYQSTTEGLLGNLIHVITDNATMSYMVTDLSSSTTYYFTVRVYDTVDLYSDSNQVSETTLAEAETLVFYEDFEGTWPGSWYVGDWESDGGEDYWGKDGDRPHNGSYSSWCAHEGAGLLQKYDTYMEAYMYRNVSLSLYQTVSLEYYYWINSELNCDFLKVGYNDSNAWHWVKNYNGSSGDWIYDTISVPVTATAVGFLFYSDAYVCYEGAYVDDVKLIATNATTKTSCLTHSSHYSLTGKPINSQITISPRHLKSNSIIYCRKIVTQTYEKRVAILGIRRNSTALDNKSIYVLVSDA